MLFSDDELNDCQVAYNSAIAYRQSYSFLVFLQNPTVLNELVNEFYTDLWLKRQVCLNCNGEVI